MKYFKYSLKDVGNNESIGPSSILPANSTTGVFSNGYYYGCADINDIGSLSDFNAVEVSAYDFYTANDQPWEAFISKGFTKNDVTYGISDEDLSRWTQTLVLLRESGVNESSSFSISDVHGQMQVMPVYDVRTTLVELGFYWNQGWASIKTTTSGSL